MSLSILVFVYLAYQIYFNWYPQPFFEIDGGWQGIRLVAAVDLVLGPLITFLIFNPAKPRKEIIFDLATILVIQFGALGYGVYATYTQRPVAAVILDDFMVSAIEEHYGGKLESVSDLRRYSDEKPPIIFADMPLDEATMQEIQRIKLEEKVLEHAQLQLYRPRAELAPALKKRQLFWSRRMDHHGARDNYEQWLRQNGKTEDEVLFSLFGGRYGRVWLVFDLDGKYLGYFF